MPGHGDLTAFISRMALSLTLWIPTINIQIRPEVERFVRIAVTWRNLCPTLVYRKTRERISELS